MRNMVRSWVLKAKGQQQKHKYVQSRRRYLRFFLLRCVAAKSAYSAVRTILQPTAFDWDSL